MRANILSLLVLVTLSTTPGAAISEVSIGDEIGDSALGQVKGEVLTNLISLLMRGTLEAPGALVSESTKKFIQSNFDEILKQTQISAATNITKAKAGTFAGKFVAGVAVDTLANVVSKMIIAKNGYTGRSVVEAGVVEAGLKSTGNYLLSGGNPGSFAVAQILLVGEVGVNVVSASHEAVSDTEAADISAIRAKLLEEQLIAVKRIENGTSIEVIRREFNNGIQSIREDAAQKSKRFFQSKTFPELAERLIYEYEQKVLMALAEYENFSDYAKMVQDSIKVTSGSVVDNGSNEVSVPIDDNFNETVFRTSDPSETDVVLDKGTIGPSIPDKTTDVQIKIVEDARPVEPPPDYTAQIAALKAQRDALIIAEIDAKFVVSESNNRLAVLRYEDLETVNYYLGVVDAEVAELRAELANGPLSPQDAARYQSLLTYQETLEAENDRINDLIEAEELKIENARLAIQETNASLVVNQSGLVGYGFNMTSYVPPTHNPGTPTDWTGYEYVPPPFPGQSPIYDNPYGFLAGGFGGSYNQTFARDMVPVVENGVTKFRFSENSGSGSYVLVPKNERTSDDFSYLSWGTDRAVAVEGSGAGLPYIDQVFWLYGEQTPTSVLEARTGSADFTGNVYGHYYRWPSSGASTIEHNAVTGTLSFSADFASDTITGNGRFNVASSAGNFSETFSLSGSLSDDNTSTVRDVSGTEGGVSYGYGSAANIVAGLTGAGGSGAMIGSFYGPDGLEAGGSISYFFGDRESAIAGVFTAREELAPTYKGILSSATPYRSGYELTLTEVTSEDRPVDGTILTVSQRDDNSANPLPRVGDTVTVSTYGVFGNNGYSYSDWGKWNGTNESGTTRGYYAVAQETLISTVEMKTGTATYTGLIGGQCIQGCGFPGPTSVSGSISLSADFTTDRVTGSMNMGNDRVSTGSLPIDAGISGNEFYQAEEWVDDLGVSYGINGVFGGPNAEEVVGGVWAHSVYGGDGFAMNGVFIAKQ